MLHSPRRQSEVLYLVVSSKNICMACLLRFDFLAVSLSTFLFEKGRGFSKVGSIHQQTFVFGLISFFAERLLRVCLYSHSTFSTGVT